MVKSSKCLYSVKSVTTGKTQWWKVTLFKYIYWTNLPALLGRCMSGYGVGQRLRLVVWESLAVNLFGR